MWTAMTDGSVNGRASIKAADIGIGMGITGTDVTKMWQIRCWRTIILQRLSARWKRGRRIYDNIRKAIQFLLGSNMSEVLSIFFATLLGFYDSAAGASSVDQSCNGLLPGAGTWYGKGRAEHYEAQTQRCEGRDFCRWNGL